MTDATKPDPRLLTDANFALFITALDVYGLSDETRAIDADRAARIERAAKLVAEVERLCTAVKILLATIEAGADEDLRLTAENSRLRGLIREWYGGTRPAFDALAAEVKRGG